MPAVAIMMRVKYSARCRSFSTYLAEARTTTKATLRNTSENTAASASKLSRGASGLPMMLG